MKTQDKAYIEDIKQKREKDEVYRRYFIAKLKEITGGRDVVISSKNRERISKG